MLTSAPADRLDLVQALRALAAVFVIFHHVPRLGLDAQWCANLFFLISGFMMCYVTESSGQHFLAKRLIRVIPLYWVATLGVFVVALLVPDALHRSTDSLEQLFKSLFFIPFDKGGGVLQPLLFVGWTLNYEMFFYLLFAVAMRISHAWRGAISAGVLVVLVALGAVFDDTSPVWVFYTSNIQLDFVIGILSYTIYQRSRPWRTAIDTRTWRAALAVTAVAILAVLPLTGPALPAFGVDLLQRVPVALAYLMLLMALSASPLPRPLVLIGDASYSLYLFHPYVVFGFERVLGLFDLPGVAGLLWVGVAVALCCVLAVFSYRHVEIPLNNALRRLLLPRAGAR